MHDRARNRGPLQLTAGNRSRRRSPLRLDADGRERARDALVDFRTRASLQHEWECDVLADRKRRQQIEKLEDRADAIARLVELLRDAMVRPTPRRPTRPTLASKQRRLEGKKRRGDVKARRGSRGFED